MNNRKIMRKNYAIFRKLLKKYEWRYKIINTIISTVRINVRVVDPKSNEILFSAVYDVGLNSLTAINIEYSESIKSKVESIDEEYLEYFISLTIEEIIDQEIEGMLDQEIAFF